MSDINIVLENRDDIHVAVEEKDINVEVPAGKDGRSLRPRGEWSASAAYAYLDLVSYQGSSYAALKAVPAGTLPTDTSYWMLSAEKGDPGASVWGDITGDLSDQTDLQTALDAKADVIISSASGSIASFSDGSASPVTALSVSIDPVQDLHGYDNPWPAGGGKNLFDQDTVYSTYKQTDGSFIIQASTALGIKTYIPSDFVGVQLTFSAKFKIPSGSTVTNIRVICNVNGSSSDGNFVNTSTYTTSSVTFTPTSTSDYIGISYGVGGNQNLQAIEFQLEKASSATAYAPYSNICPISGHTSAVVTRTGKNLFNGVLETGLYSNANFNKGSDLDKRYKSFHLFLKAGTYIFSSSVNLRLLRTVIDGVWETKSIYNATPYTIILTKDGQMGLSFRQEDNNNWDDTNKLQLELGSSATAYEPYQGQTVTIDLDGTRYGGTLDVTTGILKLTNGIVTIDSSTNFSVYSGWRFKLSVPNYTAPVATIADNIYCDRLKTIRKNVSPQPYSICGYDPGGNYIIFMATSDITTIEAMSSWLASNPLQVVYPLSEPQIIQLPPSQLSTLLGQNNIWADTGDVSVEYRADSKMYIDGKVAQTAKVTRQMIADSATADGKAPKSLATGDLIIVGDELRKATANIGNGSAITASNSTTATLADVIKALQ